MRKMRSERNARVEEALMVDQDEAMMSKGKNGKAVGPDDIPPGEWKHLGDAAAKVFAQK